MESKVQLYEAGAKRLLAWCQLNGFEPPELKPEHSASAWRFGKVCAYYRYHYIHICIPACAAPGTTGRQWSWPGYVVDRTPYGVLQHELGHAVDLALSKHKDRYRGDFSDTLRKRVMKYGEYEPITSYAPDHGEWFAEIFRLFITNDDLLAHIRPWTHGFLKEMFKPPRPLRNWQQELAAHNAPPRYYSAAQNKINAV